jgi:hypothetical protein
MNIEWQALANKEDLIKLAKILHDVIDEIIAADDKTNDNLKHHRSCLKDFIIKGD